MHEANSKVHKDTALLMQLFKQRMERDIVSIDELANSVRKQRTESNRMKLKSILKTIILCGQQDFALRGQFIDVLQYQISGFSGGFAPWTPTGALPLDPAGGLTAPPYPQL